MSDNLFVNRNNTTYQVDMENLRTIEDTDLLLVNRNGTTYTVTGDKVGGGGGDLTLVNLSPLSGTPQFVVTATTDLSAILPESTIEYKWYRYSASTGGTGTLVQELTSDSAILDTYETTGADQGGYIGCTVTYLGTTVTETARTQCLTAPGPLATMHGLRFDSGRETYLKRAKSNVIQFTFSCWVKRTGSSVFRMLQATNGNDYAILQFRDNGVVELTSNSGSSNILSSTETFAPNVWHNVVFTWVDVGGVSTIHVNGVEVASGRWNNPTFNSASSELWVGRHSTDYSDGYLSEVYFVDDAVLPPTVFGKTFEPYGWGPLDSSQIKENISNFPVLSPYDERANTDEVWSDGIAANAGNSLPVNGFNGNTTNSVYAVGTTSALEWTPPATGYTKLEIKSREDGIASQVGDGTVTVSGAGITTTVIPGPQVSDTFVNIPLTGSPVGTLSLIGTSGKVTAGICQVKLDGRILIDSTVWNNSENWSDLTSYDANRITPDQFEHLFDGDTTSSVQANQGNNDTLVWDSGVIGGNPGDVIRIYFQGTITSVTINGNVRTITQYNWFTVPENYLINLEVLHPSSGSISNPSAIELNGEILVDSGAQWDTSQVWSSTLTYAGIKYPKLLNAFDGDTATATFDVPYNNNTDSLFWDTSAYNLSGDLEVYTGDGPLPIEVNGTSVGTGSNSGGWASLGNFPNINSVEIFPLINQKAAILGAVRINGALLVDGPSFGLNGFYLPFDPTATGANYSSKLVSDNNEYTSGFPPVNAFDGSTSTECASSTTGSTFASLTLSNLGFTGTSSLVVKVTGSEVLVNGSSVSTGEFTSDEVNCGNITNLDSIVIKGGPSGARAASLFSVVVDGVLLVDHSSIGVDESGNENNFYDQNFGVGNTSQVWSKTCDEPDPTSPSKYTLFDGSYDWIWWPNDTNGGEVTFTGITVNTGDTLEIESYTGADSYYFKGTNGGTQYQFTVPNVANGNTSPTNMKPIDVTALLTTPWTLDAVGSINSLGGIKAIYYNGEQLIDANQQDTVTDTPLMNYAVLASPTSTTLSNGGLNAASGSGGSGAAASLTLTSGKYYFEAYGTDDNQSVIGFYSSVNTQNPPGDVSGVGYYQGGTSNGIIRVNGVAAAEGVGDSSSENLIGVAVNADTGYYCFYRDGVELYSATDAALEGSVTPGGRWSISGQKGSINFGQQPFAASNVIYDQATGVVEIPGAVAPYDTRANTSALWSSSIASGSFDSSYPITNAFNGNTATTAFTAPSSTLTLDLSSLAPLTSIELRLRETANSETFIIGGTAVAGQTITGANSASLQKLTGINSTGTLTIDVDGSGQTPLTQIKVNGRLLVDQGVWNNSQNWSAGGNNSQLSGAATWTSAFDGDETTAIYIRNSSATYSFPSVTNGALTIYAKSGGSSAGSVVVTVKGESYTFNFVSVGQTDVHTFASGTDLGEVSFVPSGIGVQINRVALDGELLVDEGAQWNTSQVWSNDTGSTVFENVNPVTNAYDGSLTTYARVDASQSPAESFFTPISSNNIVVYGATGSPAGGTISIRDASLSFIDVTSQFTSGSNDIERVEITGVTGISGFKLQSTTSNPLIAAIEIDGDILVDLTGGTYSSLFQTWEESKVVTFRAQLAAADVLMTALTQHAQTYNASEDYCEGSVIKAFGELWIAINTAPATTFADLPALMSHPNWERLGITV